MRHRGDRRPCRSPDVDVHRGVVGRRPAAHRCRARPGQNWLSGLRRGCRSAEPDARFSGIPVPCDGALRAGRADLAIADGPVQRVLNRVLRVRCRAGFRPQIGRVVGAAEFEFGRRRGSDSVRSESFRRAGDAGDEEDGCERVGTTPDDCAGLQSPCGCYRNIRARANAAAVATVPATRSGGAFETTARYRRPLAVSDGVLIGRQVQ